MAVTTFYYGASGDQPRAVVDRKPADIVNFSVEPGVTRLVRADEVAKDWNADNIKSIPFAGGLWDLTLYGGWHTTPEECVVAVKRYDRDSDSSNARPRGLYVRGRGL